MKKLEISIDDLKYNLNLIKSYAKGNGAGVIAVVKANGMGLDLIKYSNFLVDNGVSILAVATVDEAVLLRKYKIDCDILMLSEVFDESEIKLLIENDIIFTVGSLDLKEKINKLAIENNKKVKVHVKIDTGFGRYGFLYYNEEEILEGIKNTKNIEICGAYTHFSKPIDKKWTCTQFERFRNLIPKIKEINPQIIFHCSSSTAALLYPEMCLDYIRIRFMYSGKNIKKYFGFKKNRSF